MGVLAIATVSIDRVRSNKVATSKNITQCKSLPTMFQKFQREWSIGGGKFPLLNFWWQVQMPC